VDLRGVARIGASLDGVSGAVGLVVEVTGDRSAHEESPVQVDG
jgi:hypothetical protein